MTIQIEKMLDHILFLARRFRISDSKCIAKILVLELGISPKYDGYRYIVQAIVLYLEAPTQLSIKRLYSAVAALYNGTVEEEQVEQAIRSAIKKAWSKRNDDIWGFYFLCDTQGDMEKPSNGDVISMVACAVDLWKGWCEDYRKTANREVGSL